MQDRESKTLPLEAVRAFEAAARCGSFTEAANEIGITQSAVSQRIRQLEHFVGTTLFHRRARSVALTVQGEAWLPHVRSALQDLRDSSEALFGAGRGRLTISASHSIIELWLVPRLAKLNDIAVTELSIQTMVVGAHDTPMDDVIRIRYGLGNWPQKFKLPLYRERIAPMASPALLKIGGDWMNWPRIACAGPRPGWHEWASRFSISTTPVPRLRFDSFYSALSAARSGLGVLLGSLPLCESDIRAGRLVRLCDDVLDHHESYWAIAGKDAVTRSQWEELAAAMRP